LRKLRQYWQSLFASKNKSVKTPADSSPGPEKLEREIAAVSSENQTLSANLEEVRQEIAAARNADKHKLAELERVSHTLEIARQEEVTKRSELENRLDEIVSERNQARDQISGLKISLAEASTRLEKTDNQFKQLELEQRLHEKMLLETQTQLRTQDQRLSWTMMVAGFAVVLAAVSGVILILEAHKNATLLTGMNADMQQLLTSMDQHLDTRHQTVAEIPVTAAVVAPATTTTTAKATDQDNPAATTDSGALPEEATDAAGNAPTAAYLPAPPVLDDRQKHSRMLSAPRKKPAFNEAGADWTMANLPGGMLYRVETPGRGRSPDMTDRVVVNYLAVSPNGEVIDDTYSSGQPATLRMSELTPALQEALLHMGEGAEWEVTVPEQQQGTQGSEPGLYLIELIEVIEGEVPDPSMPPE